MIPATVFWGLLSEYYEKSEIQNIYSVFRLFLFPYLPVAVCKESLNIISRHFQNISIRIGDVEIIVWPVHIHIKNF